MSAPNDIDARLREILAADPWFGDWDEWDRIAYSKIPVLPRVALRHLYGFHDDSEFPYGHCVLCKLVRDQPSQRVRGAE